MSDVFDYKMAGRIRGVVPGGHKSRQRGAGSDFYRKSPFLSEPDSSKIDLKTSLTDPFETLHIRSYRQHSKLRVVLLIDGSSSMLYAGKPALLTRFYNSLAASVDAAGDERQAYLLTGEIQPLPDEQRLCQALSSLTPEHNNAGAFSLLERILPSRPALVFIVSDFHWPEPMLQGVMATLSRHGVVPVVLWQSTEYSHFPAWRFIELTDLETGEAGLVFLTPAQIERLQASYAARSGYLKRLFQRYNCRPFWLSDHYSATQMNHYFSAQ